MIRDLRGVAEREGAALGVFLTLADPTKPMISEAAGAGQDALPGFAPVPRPQIVTIGRAMRLGRPGRASARAAKEHDPGAQSAFSL